MKKTIFIIIGVVVLLLTFNYFKNIYGRMEFRKNTDTSDQYLSKTLPKKEDYIEDSLAISTKLRGFLLQHKDFFYSKEYFEGTDIIIDTIVYSPDLTKLGILVIAKNPTSRQLIPTKDRNYYYDATVYLCVKQHDTLDLIWLGPSFTNAMDKSELSRDIRQACFRRFVDKDTPRKYAYDYNLNDIRFWTSSVWQKVEEDKIRRKVFEEEKIKHPENVYEPPK
jgi:hypothetical protein